MAKIKRWWKLFWAWITRKKARENKNSPFREFVYLDEISVLSLLVSREGELTEQIQEGYTHEDSVGGEIGSSIGGKETSVSSKSTYQTKSSQSVQATRKANIQSQFRRLHKEVKKAGLVFPMAVSDVIHAEEKLLKNSNISRAIPTLERGNLVELDVHLSADRLFSMGSIITEVASMSEDHPDIFGSGSTGIVSGEMKSYAKLLDRFMAGLVPTRSIVTNVRLYEAGGKKYLVDAAIAEELGLTTQQIELVGVLEKDRFWKDMRRVLFSDAKVTVLARMSVDGIQDKWTPVKLMDLFEKNIPGGDSILSAFQTVNFEEAPVDDARRSAVFKAALENYVEQWVSDAGLTLTSRDQGRINSVIEENSRQWGSVELQRSAFRLIAEQLEHAGVVMNSGKDAEYRQVARGSARINPFGEIATEQSQNGSTDASGANIVEVEVVAMYW